MVRKQSVTQTAAQTVDRKRSLAAKKGAATRARNKQLLLENKRQLRLHHKILSGGLIAAVLVLTFLGIHGQLSSYAASTVKTYNIVGIGGKCIDNYNNMQEDRTVIQLYTCGPGKAEQWTVSNGGIKSASGNFCIDVPGQSKDQGIRVWLWSCNGTKAQKLAFSGSRIVNSNTGFCLTAENGSSENNTRLVMNKCNSSASQKWAMKAVGTTAATPKPTPAPKPTTAPSNTTASGSASSDAKSGTSTNSLAGNIAVLPDFYNGKWLGWNDGYNKFPVSWQGYSNVLQVAPNPKFMVGQRASGWTGENEINGHICSGGAITGCSQNSRDTRVSVRPGSKITYSAYVWVTPSTVGAPNGGGFQFFMDVYGSNGRIKELQGTGGCDGCGRVNVPYGSKDWTFVQMQVTVANSYKADGALGGGSGQYVTPTGIIPILQLNNWAIPSGYNDKAVAYIRNTVLTVK